MAHPKDKALQALHDAIDSIWLNTRAHYSEAGFNEAQEAWVEVHRDKPDLGKALDLARNAEAANGVKWGALRSTIESLVLAERLPRLGE